MDKPPFEWALRVLAVRQRHGVEHQEHPSLTDLLAYRARILSAEEEDGLQEHLTHCRRCLHRLLDLNELLELVEFQQLPPTEEMQVEDPRAEASWKHLQQRLVEERQKYPKPNKQTTHGEAPKAEQTGGGSVLTLQLPAESRTFEAYEVALVPAIEKDPAFEHQTMQAQAGGGSMTLQLSPSSLPRGSYTVHLYGLTGGQRHLLDGCRFEISPPAP